MIPNQNPKKEETRELGFGSRLNRKGSRLINKDGSFNVERRERPGLTSFGVYHWLVSISWFKFNVIILSFYILVNILFAFIYLIAGVEGISGTTAVAKQDQFLDAFFFSAQTLTTVGYGRLSPTGHLPSLIASIEALIGLLGFALVTGLLYGRFSRPKANLIFSKQAIVAPFKNLQAFQFRVANKLRNSQLIEVEAKVMVGKLENENGQLIRRFRQIELEIKRINFFPMTWTVNHPIDENSPLYGMTQKDFEESDMEFMILISGFDDTFSQNVHTRFSYKYNEVVWGAKFVSVFGKNAEGNTFQDLEKIDLYEPVDLLVKA